MGNYLRINMECSNCFSRWEANQYDLDCYGELPCPSCGSYDTYVYATEYKDYLDTEEDSEDEWISQELMSI